MNIRKFFGIFETLLGGGFIIVYLTDFIALVSSVLNLSFRLNLNEIGPALTFSSVILLLAGGVGLFFSKKWARIISILGWVLVAASFVLFITTFHIEIW